MSYVDGYVIAVPTDKKAEYIEIAELSASLFKDCGALSVVENWGDDVPPGEKTSFPMAVQCEASETVVFSWVVWPSKEAREKGMKLMMEDPRMQKMGPESVPFDGSRLIYASFETIVSV